MNKLWLRFGELAALVTLAIGLLALAAYMVAVDRMGEAFGTVLTTLPLVVQAIRNIGQSEAMNSMADYLAKSRLDTGDTPQPVKVTNAPSEPVPVDAAPEPDGIDVTKGE